MKNNKLLGTLSASLMLSSTVLAQGIAEAEESVDLIKRQLSAQQAINQQLKQRVEALERELASQRNSTGPLIVGLDTAAAAPKEILDTNPIGVCHRRSVGRERFGLLPVGSYRLTPSVFWSHSSKDSYQTDSYVAGATLEAGLPMGMAISLRQPYVWRDYSYGNNKGWGDVSLGLAKRLNHETPAMPSFVLRLGYSHDSGKDAFNRIPIGSGFRAYDLGITAVKRFEPLVLFGGLSHTQVRASNAVVQITSGANPLFTSQIKPGSVYGLSMGVSLAATPEVSLDASLSLSFADKTRLTLDSGETRYGKRSTRGNLNLGMSYLLTRNFSLSVSATAGLTPNDNDVGLSIALPYRF
jgi:hypothetical protein